MAWTDDDVEAWLTDFPLPKDFVFNGEKVWPRYRVKRGYGYWLRTAGPYHPALRGLFRLIVRIVTRRVEREQPLPTPEELTELILDEAKSDELPLALDTLDQTQPKPSDNPDHTESNPGFNPSHFPSDSQP